MKHFSIFILICFFTSSVYGQRFSVQYNYYTTDTLTVVGAEIIDGGLLNSYYCVVKKGDKLIKFNPYEVSKYSLKNGQIYKAFDIVIDTLAGRYFLEQIVKGDLGMYYLKLKGGIKKFYLSSGDSSKLTEIPENKKECQELIKYYLTNCSHARQNLKFLRYNKSNIKRYLNNLNSCSDAQFPRFQFGLRMGIAATHYSPAVNTGFYSALHYSTDWGYMTGLFMNMPINSGNLSISPEIAYIKHHNLASITVQNTTYDLILNFSTIDIPIFLRYSILRKKYTPFIQAGPVYSHNFNNNTSLYKYTVNNNDIFIDLINSQVIQKNMIGFSLGGGINSSYAGWYGWFGELRYSTHYNINQSKNYLYYGELSLNMGFIF